MVSRCGQALGDGRHMASSAPQFVATDVAQFKIHMGPFYNFTLPAAHQRARIAVRQFGPVNEDFLNNLQLTVSPNLL